MKFKAIFFDLDGTLLDTAPDFFACLNAMLQENNKPPMQYDLFKQNVYGNSDTMVAYAFDMKKSHPDFEKIRLAFIEKYKKNCTKHTDYFPGMNLILDQCDEKKIPWGIITNKPTDLTLLVLNHFDLPKRAAIIICGDTLQYNKPNPAQLLYACEKVNIKPNQAVYIGDLKTDVIAAKTAFMQSVIMAFGYQAPHAKIADWNADFVAQDSLELEKFLF